MEGILFVNYYRYNLDHLSINRGEYQKTEVAIKQVRKQDLTPANIEAVKREAEIM